jgi:replication initiation protein RepC
MAQALPIAPFGRRSLTLGQIATDKALLQAVQSPTRDLEDALRPVNKWHVFRMLAEIRESLGISDRSLSLLSALLSFFPEEELSLGDAAADCDRAGELIVFPSNKQLGLRAHGMAEKTIRRHLAALVEAGLVLRRDSPNGKRYARKSTIDEQSYSEKYGFDLSPLLLRAPEFESRQLSQRHALRQLAVAREKITLVRRDIAKMLDLADEKVLAGPWAELRRRFALLVQPVRRVPDCELEGLLIRLIDLQHDAFAAFPDATEASDMTGNDGIIDRHISDSNTDVSDLEPALNDARGKTDPEPKPVAQADTKKTLPLGLVLEACPDLKPFFYSGGDIRSWRDFVAAASEIRSMIGISPDAWRDAVETMGDIDAAISVALILQRSEHSSESRAVPGPKPGATIITVNGSPAIHSAGGYLRSLTEQSRKGKLALGSIVMALIGQRVKAARAKREAAASSSESSLSTS